MTKARISNDLLVLIEAEMLSADAEFMRYEPITLREKATKSLIMKAISLGVKNFYKPKCDPSFTEDGESICFVPGKEPAVGKSYHWWLVETELYGKDFNCHVGTNLQYGAFLGVLISKLVAEGKTVKWAWNAVCNDSRELGHYWNSTNAMYKMEPTGSREICGSCDLANTYKILADHDNPEAFWLAAGNYFCNGDAFSIAGLYLSYDGDIADEGSTGWLIVD